VIPSSSVTASADLPSSHQQLGQLLDRRFVFRICLEDAPENLFGLVVFILQAVKPRQPQRRFRVRRIEAV